MTNQLTASIGTSLSEKTYLQPIPLLSRLSEQEEYLQNYPALEKIGQDLQITTEVEHIVLQEFDFRFLMNSSMSIGLMHHILKLVRVYFRDWVRVSRLYKIMQILLDYFEEDEISIIPELLIGNQYCIDLFIEIKRGGKLRRFAIILKTKGDASVRWRPDLKTFLFTRKGRQPTPWKDLSASLKQLQSISILTKSKNPLLGVTNSQRKTFITKAIVCCSGTKLNPDSTPDLWHNFGRTRVLKIDSGEIGFFILEQEQLIDFLLPVEETGVTQLEKECVKDQPNKSTAK